MKLKLALQKVGTTKSNPPRPIKPSANHQHVLGFALPFASLSIMCDAEVKTVWLACFDFSLSKICCTMHQWSCSNYNN
jgi:hypothetical protein